jgi:hypothetical protein
MGGGLIACEHSGPSPHNVMVVLDKIKTAFERLSITGD